MGCQCLPRIATGIFLHHVGQGSPPLPDALFNDISFQIQHKSLLSQYMLFPVYVKHSSVGIFSLFLWFSSMWAVYLSPFLIVVILLWSLLPLGRRFHSFPQGSLLGWADRGEAAMAPDPWPRWL